ncbi:MAG: TolC family protein [Proteobacteria bacterium]|nr:TolC family protein [Cystobacterineae bacterium]MCL2258978.1 TolC family protein [Cystobacterineae bacterium]MCL2314664.1 TolC family protein [Pseudomonadota bacterium]
MHRLFVLASLGVLGVPAFAQEDAALPQTELSQTTMLPTQAPQPPALQTTAPPSMAEDVSKRPVGLEEALRLALANNANIKTANSKADAVAAQASRVWAAVLPDIKASGSYVYTNVPQELDMNLFVGFISQVFNVPAPAPDPALVSTITDKNSLYGSLQLTQVLFTPQMFLIKNAAAGTEAARLGTRDAVEQILGGVAKTYLAIVGISSMEEAARDAEAVALRRERDARARIRVGKAVETELLRALTDTAQARSQLAQLEGQREALLALLESMTGEPIRPAPTEDAVFMNFGEAKDEADSPWEASFGISAAEKNFEVMKRFSKTDSVTWLPTLAASARGLYNSNTGFTGKHFTFDLTLGLSWHLYDQGVREATTRENRANLVAARAQLNAARSDTRAKWISAKKTLESARMAALQAQTQAEMATRVQQQVESLFKAGMATSLELSTADNGRFFAASNAAQARTQMEIARVELAAVENRIGNTLGVASP